MNSLALSKSDLLMALTSDVSRPLPLSSDTSRDRQLTLVTSNCARIEPEEKTVGLVVSLYRLARTASDGSLCTDATILSPVSSESKALRRRQKSSSVTSYATR